MNERIEAMRARYLAAMLPTRRQKTVNGYHGSIASLFHFLEEHHSDLSSLAELSREPHITGWLGFLASRKPPYAIDSRRRYIFQVRNFLDRIHDWGWEDAPPHGLLTASDLPKSTRHLPRPLAPEIDLKIQEGLKQDGSIFARALLLMRFTGVRIGELQRLQHDCLVRGRAGRHSVRIPLGKLRTERMVPIDDATVTLIQSIRAECGMRPEAIDEETGHPVQFLLSDPNGRPYLFDRFRLKLRRVAAAANIKERVYPHRLRHTYATDLLRHGMSLPAVMKLLGHTSLTMTLRYVDVAPDDLAKSYLAAAEKARAHYATLPLPTPATGAPATPPGDEPVTKALHDVIARLQQLRFDRQDTSQRAGLQRQVERLRRAHDALLAILGDAK